MIYLELFWEFFKIGILGIGGGYAAIPLIQSSIVEGKGWLTTIQFADLLAIDELTPGPIAINAATFVGMQVSGILGAIIATLGFVCPSIIIISVLAVVYNRFKKLSVMQSIMKTLKPVVAAAVSAAAVALITLAFWGEKGYSTQIVDLNIISVFIFGLGIFLLRKHKINPLLIIVGSGALGAVFYILL